jgi:tRNA 5-methylaminomethyl-2-thiouridine biosynthesis bifunctional protein
MTESGGNDRAGPFALLSAQPRWEAGHVLRATRFDDVYFNRDGGLAEKRHVFLNGCGLPDGWRSAESYTIGELGFGIGLTFLATWEVWRRTHKPGARLHYLAVEGYPLTQVELSDSLQLWPEVQPLAAALLRAYPPPQPGFHRLILKASSADDPVYLTSLCGDVVEMLQQLEASIDAWFLDGFSPEKNPGMWTTEVVASVARVSHGTHAADYAETRGLTSASTRISTYTVAGSVRRALQDAGFEIARTKGFGAKREMLCGAYDGRNERTPLLSPWFARPVAAPRTHGHVAIVGAGIAGCAVAAAMTRRGWTATLIDRSSGIAQGASGNPTGILMPRVTAAPNLDSRFSLAAWRFLLQTLEDLADAGVPVGRSRCGVLQLATDDGDAERLVAVAATGLLPESLMAYLSPREASDFAGCALDRPGLLFPQAGIVEPPTLCSALAHNARRLLAADVFRFHRGPSGIELIDRDNRVRTIGDVVVIANGVDAVTFPFANWLPLSARRGQLTLAPPTAASEHLRCVLSYGGYVTPTHHGRHAIGATFDLVENPSDSQRVIAEDHARNLADLARVAPSLMATIDDTFLEGRAGLRCVTPDHLPVVGPVPDQAAYLTDYAQLRHGQHWVHYPNATYQAGIYLLTGLGARGLTEAPLAAELLACHITGEPWPMERGLATALHPARFLVRDLKRLRA